LAEGLASADWKNVYYIKSQEHAYYDTTGDRFIQSSLVLCDDGSHQPGNDPESAMRRIGDVCWCTDAFVDHDVDLVADLTTPHLVMEFQASNGGSRFSAPVKEALAFASLMAPNLEAAHVYDGEAGIQKAREMVAGDKNEGRSRSVPPGHPRAGFVFPGIPQAFNAICSRPSVRPTVARFVHFKLLTSSKCSWRVSNNIDVCSLFTFGVPLLDLSAMIHNEVENMPLVPDPSPYNRRHQVREYPWHIHETFQQQELEVANQDDQHFRLAQVQRLLRQEHEARLESLLPDLTRRVRESMSRSNALFESAIQIQQEFVARSETDE
jgi:hypothetical protein